MIWQHQLDDAKRRCMELEDKLTQSKQLCEDLRLLAEAPTQDHKTTTSSGGQQNRGKDDSEEVLQLHEQLTDMAAQLTAMEN